MPEEADPPRKSYALKPREFERLNPPTAAGAGAGRIDVRDHFEAAAAPADQPLLHASKAARRENEVHAILKANLARANAAGLNDLAPLPPKKSRRKRDYILVTVAANAAFGAMVAWALSEHDLEMLVRAGAGIIVFNVGITWVMWFVMDDY